MNIRTPSILQAVRSFSVSTVLFLLMASAQGQAERLHLSIDDPRPVAKAIELLMIEHPGFIATYEDPPYRYREDIRDVTAEVRRDIHLHPAGNVPRVIGPMGGSFDFSYSVRSETGEPADWMEVLQEVLTAHQVGARGGRFRVERSGDVFHVVPTEVRDGSGVWVGQTSILDELITIPAQEGNGYEMLTAICKAVSDVTGIPVVVGTIPNNLFARHEGLLEADAEPAKEVLLRTLRSIHPRLTWRLLYGPSRERYALNVRGTPARPEAPADGRPVAPTRPTSPGPAVRE